MWTEVIHYDKIKIKLKMTNILTVSYVQYFLLV